MRKVTRDIIHASYEVAKKTHEKQMTLKQGLDLLQSKYGMNRNTATDYIYTYVHMVKGERFCRTTNIDGTEYYLTKIYEEGGPPKLLNALNALRLHLDYYEATRNTSVRARRAIYNRFFDITTEASASDLRERCTGVFSRNHRMYLEHAAQVANGNPQQIVTFRSSSVWRSAIGLLEQGIDVQIYFAVVDEGPIIRFKAWLRRVILHPDRRDIEVKRLLRLAPPKTKTEGLWKGKVLTLFAISDCYKLPRPFPMSRLKKVRDGQFIAEDYGYSYSLVTLDDEEISIIPKASDVVEPPARFEAVVTRVIRDIALVRRLKRLHEDRCQRCGLRLELRDGSAYSEGHHLKPLGRPHEGPDIPENLLVLCPNCHALFDLFGIQIEIRQLRAHPEHRLADEYIAYHNSEVRRRRQMKLGEKP